jgi:uncharacterized membrane protein
MGEAETMADNKNSDTPGNAMWRKAESIVFPLAAVIVVVGYACGILLNNRIDKVLHSPHAIMLLAVFCLITFFSLRSLVKELKTAGKDDSE